MKYGLPEQLKTVRNFHTNKNPPSYENGFLFVMGVQKRTAIKSTH